MQIVNWNVEWAEQGVMYSRALVDRGRSVQVMCGLSGVANTAIIRKPSTFSFLSKLVDPQMPDEILDGVIIGGAGGAIAGITVSVVNGLWEFSLREIHKRRVYDWLCRNTRDEVGKRLRSTRSIASHNNLTEDRARYICSEHRGIVLNTGDAEDMWGLKSLLRPDA